MAGDDLLVWAIRREGLIASYAFKTEDWRLLGQINDLRKAIQQRHAWIKASRVLAAQLLSPIEPFLRPDDQLLIVPHGPLHTLPFQVLPLQDGSLLGLRHNISYLPSATVSLFLPPVHSLSEARVLAIGNPTGDLAAAATEALFVAQQFEGQSVALIEQEATAVAVSEQLLGANLLHFATHGHLSESAPLQSALLLANGEQLTLEALMGIRLEADLVVLSACDTARGARTGGDDVLGLTRGLIAGGTKSAIVSLWAVNDNSTALLMGYFYQCLKKGISPANALRLAQHYLAQLDMVQQSEALHGLERALSNSALASRDIAGFNNGQTDEVDYRHPYYWAGFILVGSLEV